MGKVHRQLAQTVRRTAEHSAHRYRLDHIGTVIDLSPFRVELHDRADILVEDHNLLISQWVAFYHAAWGIQRGDNALISMLHGHYWWYDVGSDTDCSPATAQVAWSL